MKPQLVNITPETAKRMLSNNPGNRKLNERHVSFLASQMLSGKWKFTGDPIKISKENRLLDGQHRLQAVVKSNKESEFLVLKDMDDDIFSVLDTGKSRTASDILSMRNVQNSNMIASICRFIILIRAKSFHKKGSVTNDEVLRFVENNPELIEIMPFISKAHRGFRFMSLTGLAGLYYIISRKNQSKADEFIELYTLGMNLTKDHPVRLLRERLIKESVSKSKLPTVDKTALMIIAWNYFVSGKTLAQLKWQKDSEFPKII